jgi:hypothetical protein
MSPRCIQHKLERRYTSPTKGWTTCASTYSMSLLWRRATLHLILGVEGTMWVALLLHAWRRIPVNARETLRGYAPLTGHCAEFHLWHGLWTVDDKTQANWDLTSLGWKEPLHLRSQPIPWDVFSEDGAKAERRGSHRPWVWMRVWEEERGTEA